MEHNEKLLGKKKGIVSDRITDLEDSLSFSKDYEMVIHPPTLEEMERTDETELMKELEYLNSSFRGKNKSEFYNELTNFCQKNFKETSTNLRNRTSALQFNKMFHEPAQNVLPKPYSSSSKNDNKINLFENDILNFSTLASSNESKTELDHLINQNLIVSDEVLKIMLIGDKGVGKTTFLDYVMNSVNCKINKQIYAPTTWYKIY